MIIALIIVLGAIVLLDSAKKSRQETARRLGNAEFNMRKTNARREAKYIQEGLDEGLDLEDSIDASKARLIKEGFIPCIPKDRIKLKDGDSSKIDRGENVAEGKRSRKMLGLGEDPDPFSEFASYDSDCVKTIEHILLEEGKDTTEKNVYEMFPKSSYAYEHLLGVSAAWHRLGDIGTTFTLPFDGTCEVVGRKVCYEQPVYEAKRLSDGKIIRVKPENKTLRYVEFKMSKLASSDIKEYRKRMNALIRELKKLPDGCWTPDSERAVIMKRICEKNGWNYKE